MSISTLHDQKSVGIVLAADNPTLRELATGRVLNLIPPAKIITQHKIWRLGHFDCTKSARSPMDKSSEPICACDDNNLWHSEYEGVLAWFMLMAWTVWWCK
jgi:hypothetical protein